MQKELNKSVKPSATNIQYFIFINIDDISTHNLITVIGIMKDRLCVFTAVQIARRQYLKPLFPKQVARLLLRSVLQVCLDDAFLVLVNRHRLLKYRSGLANGQRWGPILAHS